MLSPSNFLFSWYKSEKLPLFYYRVSVAAKMSFVDTLRQWDDGVTCADKQDYSEALRILVAIREPNSKICFNIGCLHLLNQNLDDAEKVKVKHFLNWFPSKNTRHWRYLDATVKERWSAVWKRDSLWNKKWRKKRHFHRGSLYFTGIRLQHTQGWASGSGFLSKRNHFL